MPSLGQFACKRHLSRLPLLLSSVAFAVSGGLYGPRHAIAGACNPNLVAPNFRCTGIANAADVTQNVISTNGINASTDAVFGIDTSATGGDAITLTNSGGSAGILFSQSSNGPITGQATGLSAQNSAAGDIDITTTGPVTGATGDGVFVSQSSAGDDTIVNTGAVTGNTSGITALHRGSGSVSVTSTGLVTATNAASAGLDVQAYRGTGVSISAASVTGGQFGIRSTNRARGNLTVTGTGTITSTTTSATSRGIHLLQYNTLGGDVLVTLAAGSNVAGGQYGVRVTSYALYGATTINALGSVSGNATVGDGLVVDTIGTGIVINAHNVSGTRDGLTAVNTGSGGTDITVTGVINGASRFGIFTQNAIGNPNTITLNAGADVSGGQAAIVNDDGDIVVTVNNGARISGDILLEYTISPTSTDVIIFNTGADFTGVGLMDAGGGNDDVLTFDNVVGTAPNARVSGFETINAINNADANLSNTITFDGPNTLNILGDSRFSVGGDFNHTGTINMNDAAAGDRLIIAGDMLLNTGTIGMDVDFATNTADTITLQGIPTTPLVIDLTGVNLAAADGTSILVIDVTGGAAGQTVSLLNGPITAGGLVYDLIQDTNNDWFLFAPPPPPSGTPATVPYSAYQMALLALSRLPNYQDRVAARIFDSAKTDRDPRFAVWGRIEGREARQSVGVGKMEFTSAQVEAGFDIALGAGGLNTIGGSHGWVAGVTAIALDSKTDAFAPHDLGRVNTSGQGIGATLSYHMDSFYADAQIRHLWLASDFTDATGTVLARDRRAASMSAGLELGYRADLADRLTLIPEAQLVYTHVDTENILTSTGATAAFEQTESLSLRLGVAGQLDINPSALIRLEADLRHEFLDETSGALNGNRFTAESAEWSGDMGISFALAHEQLSLYGGAHMSGDLEALDDTYGFGAHLGMRVLW